jgi:hypothetical protein
MTCLDLYYVTLAAQVLHILRIDHHSRRSMEIKCNPNSAMI